VPAVARTALGHRWSPQLVRPYEATTPLRPDNALLGDFGYSVPTWRQPKKAANRNIQKLHCNDCRRVTLHKLLKETHDQGSEPWDEEIRTYWDIVHQMFECCGCKSVVVRRSHEFSEWEYPDVRYYPPPVSRHKPEWFDETPAPLQSLLMEITTRWVRTLVLYP
jgi:hypothetical protein